MPDTDRSHESAEREDASGCIAHDLDSIDDDLSLMNGALAALDRDDLAAAEALAARLANSTAPSGLPASDRATTG